LWGGELKQTIIDSGATVVIRPDSGDPATVVLKCLDILAQQFGYTWNDKGYKIINNVRVLQGDGINYSSIKRILEHITGFGYSADNVAFGMGGALLQKVDRDTQKWAMKCSAIKVNGVWRDVYKDPITDSGKSSKKGLVTLYKDENGYFSGIKSDTLVSELQTVFHSGVLMNETTFDEIRKEAEQC
jgi:nicotinamide phosphoribosyltransferase